MLKKGERPVPLVQARGGSEEDHPLGIEDRGSQGGYTGVREALRPRGLMKRVSFEPS